MRPGAGVILGAKYELVAPLGKGGMGEVWRARALDLDAPVAVKLLLEGASTPSARARFEREARAAAALRSPHVVQVLGYGLDEPLGVPFIVLELLEGETLRQRLERQGKLSMGETQRWIVHIARALTRAHAAGIVHRDLKPENVFLVNNGDERIAKVLDFGVAKQSFGPAHTATGTVLGTIHYMAPEQLEGRLVDHRADLWSLTVLAAECLTGERVVEGDTFGEIAARVVLGRVRRPSSIASVPSGFDEWFARGTCLRPDDRFESADELAQSLARLSDAAREPPPSATAAAEDPALLATLAPTGPAPVTVVLDVTHTGGLAAPASGQGLDVTPLGEPTPGRVRVVSAGPRPSSFEALSVRPLQPASFSRRLRASAALASGVSLVLIAWMLARRSASSPELDATVARLQGTTPPSESPVVVTAPSVALLPFDVIGGSDADRYFADGVHTDLLARLGGVSDLRVASREVLLGYRGVTASPAQIARELGVQHIVRTELEPHGSGTAFWRVRVHDAEGHEVWSRTYERALDDAPGLLSVLSPDLVAALSPRLSAAERQRLVAPASASSRAYGLYLQAQHDGRTYDERERLLTDAVQLDPMFARAWLALADQRSNAYQWNVRRTPQQLDAASFALGKAQALAPDDPEVQKLAAWSYGALHGDWSRAYREVTALSQAYPNSGPVQYLLSRAAERRGEPERAMDHLRRAWELEPARDDYGWWLAYDQAQLRRYDEARRTLQRVEASPFYAEAGRDFDAARLDFMQSGDASALRAWERGLSAEARARPDVRARLLDLAWELGDAESLLERASAAPDGVVDVPLRQIFLAIGSLDRGDREGARRWLDRAEQASRAELSTQPDNARTHARLGLLLAVRGGQPERALEHAKRALRLVPDDVDAYSGPQLRAAYTCTLAWLGDREGAVRELSLAVRRPYPEDHSFFFPLHVEHLKVGLEWKPLRELPAFGALLAAPQARAPL
jgi:serine/threonine-protein kinase